MLDEENLQFNVLGRYAGFITRLVAFVVDRVITAIIALVTVVGVDWALKAFRINQLLFGFEDIQWQVASAFSTVVYLVVSIAYDLGFWMLVGQTPGKQLLGVRIVRADGERLRLGNAIRRELAYVVSGILFLGYLWILFDNRRQGLHDKLAGTIVVYAWPEGQAQSTLVQERLQGLVEEYRTARREALPEKEPYAVT
jgi:uncharacterized RDD family membrane protein YckC